MENKYLLEDEHVVTRSKDNTVTPTNYRVQHSIENASNKHTVSIFLSKISSVELHYKTAPIFLLVVILIALASIILGPTGNQKEILYAGLLLGGLFILFFFLSRRHTITISSDGGAKINFHTKGMHKDAILNFINQVEKQKLSTHL